jgi:hypothetical protein
MDMLKLRTSPAADEALGLKAVDKALMMDAEATEQTQPQKRAQDPALGISNNALTADRVSMYVRGISENSTEEIDGLISDLRGLQEKLVDDGSRIEQAIVEFAAFNQSVIKLTETVSEGVAQVKTARPH